MSEKRESDEFEEDDADGAVEGDEDLDSLFKDFESQKRRGAAPKGGEPAWRRLEKYMEQKRTAELLSDFDDYDLDEDSGGEGAGAGGGRRRKKRLA
jgi:hypothetical protein